MTWVWLSHSVCLHSCGGKRTCSFQANNSLFGDPCIGTFKYLTVSYSCDWGQLWLFFSWHIFSSTRFDYFFFIKIEYHLKVGRLVSTRQYKVYCCKLLIWSASHSVAVPLAGKPSLPTTSAISYFILPACSGLLRDPLLVGHAWNTSPGTS